MSREGHLQGPSARHQIRSLYYACKRRVALKLLSEHRLEMYSLGAIQWYAFYVKIRPFDVFRCENL